MASGFLEIQGGTQPALPTAGYKRLWYDSSTGRWFIIDSAGTNKSTFIDVLSGHASPTSGTGNVGDLYFKSATGDLFTKADATTWVFLFNISQTEPTNKFIKFEDDFLGTAADQIRLETTTAGTGASAQVDTFGVDGTERALGVWSADTGATTTGRASFHTTLNGTIFGICTLTTYFRMAIPVLSDATDRFTVRVGFGNNTSAGEHTDGVFFRYKDDVNGGRWVCVAINNGTETAIDSGVAANIVYNYFVVEVNEAATEATFYINDVLVGTITTNIPVFPNPVGQVLKIEKSVGTAASRIAIDYWAFCASYSGDR